MRAIGVLSALVPISCAALYTVVCADEFILRGGSGQEEIEVRSGEEFRIGIDGAGWYLNRYDRQRLKFRYRIVDPAVTSFVIMPLQTGEGYLLFSYRNEDLYVRVVIDRKGEPGGTDGQAPAVTDSGTGGDTGEQALSIPEGGTAEPEAARAATREGVGPAVSHDDGGEEAPLRESKDPSVREKDESGRGQVGVRKPKDTERIYYTDEEGRVVPVPADAGRDEGYEYRRGTALYKGKRFSEAAERFVRYLDRCEECEKKIDASMKLAESLVAVGREKEAIPHLDTVIDSSQDSYREKAYIMRGNIYYDEGLLKKALRSYRGALDAGAASVEVLRRVGDLHYELNEYGPALEAYERLIKLGAVDDVLFFRVATIYDSPGEPRDIEKAYGYYKLLVDGYRKSEYRLFAAKRMEFLEKNFFNYR
ncbi:MAG: tetratricopeptide repeat protein [Spirochaetes bacterium]|nr:tetratricopeptide repeat protein [Spirochaetota bacterium]